MRQADAFQDLLAATDTSSSMPPRLQRIGSDEGQISRKRIWRDWHVLDEGEIRHSRCAPGAALAAIDLGAPTLILHIGVDPKRVEGHFYEAIAYPDGRVPAMNHAGGGHEFMIVIACHRHSAASQPQRLSASQTEKVWRLMVSMRSGRPRIAVSAAFAQAIGGVGADGSRRTSCLVRAAIRELECAWHSGLKTNELASRLRVSSAHLCRRFKASCNVSIGRYVKLLRLNNAAAMLWATSLPICEIAMACGYCDQSHLTREMLALFGITPGCMRRLAPGA